MTSAEKRFFKAAFPSPTFSKSVTFCILKAPWHRGGSQMVGYTGSGLIAFESFALQSPQSSEPLTTGSLT